MKYEIRAIKDAKEVFEIVANLDGCDSFRVNKHVPDWALGNIRSRIIVDLEKNQKTNFIVKNDTFEKIFSKVSTIKTVSEAYAAAYEVNPVVKCMCANVYLMAQNITVDKLEDALSDLEKHHYPDQNVKFIVMVPCDGMVWANY